MSLYAIAIFLHVIGALALFAGLGLEWAGLLNLRRSLTTAQVRDWTKLLGAVRVVASPAGLVILVSGIYMSATRWGRQAWIGLGLIGLVTMVVLGLVLSARRIASLVRAIPAQDGPIPPELQHRVTDPVLQVSAWLRTGLGLGVVFLMTVKPTAPVALAALGVSLVVGLAAGLPGWSRSRRAVPVAQQSRVRREPTHGGR